MENNKELGPEKFEDWLKSIDRYTENLDNLEVMYNNYLEWFEKTEEEVVYDRGTKEVDEFIKKFK